MSHVPQPGRLLFVLIIVLAVLVAAGPTLVALVHAAVPLVIAGGVVAVVLRLVFFHTRRW
jgi:hypothetical protein